MNHAPIATTMSMPNTGQIQRVCPLRLRLARDRGSSWTMARIIQTSLLSGYPRAVLR